MSIPRFKFNKLYQGDTLLFSLTVKQDGVAFNLSGCTVFFTVKEDAAQADANALLAYQTGDGITQSGSVAEVHVPYGVTDNWPTDVDLYADVQVKTGTGELFPAATGTLRFRADVTQRTS